MRSTHARALFLLIILTCSSSVMAGYKATKHRALKPGEVAVSKPGNYAKPGTTYVLTKNIQSPRSAIFLGKDVTLDLNGYTISYADGNYQHVPNHSFDQGLKGWDVSKAPGAVVKDMHMRHPLVGKNVCILPAGDELVSPYITLPEANRAYYAMVAVASHESRVDVFVDDENGKSVECAFMWGTTRRPCLPERGRPAKLGGGVVFGLMFGKPAGKYRIRVRAAGGRSAIIDEVDIRPAMDAGISIVDETMPWAYYKCILDGDGCQFFDYTKKGSTSLPVDSIPRVRGAGKIVIKNGVIRSGTKGIRSWAIDSSAKDVEIVVDNVKIQSQGINTNAIRMPFGTVKNCRVELDTPFIIDRHRRGSCGISLTSKAHPSEVFGCELVGGQGQLQVGGRGSKVHDNLFVNKQTVTNHYSVSCDGDYIKIYKNRFHPEIGSGIYIYKHRGNEIYDNEFKIKAEPPINEYGNTDYSVNAIRISDYNASKGSAKGWCEDNKIYRNKFHITGRTFPGAHPRYKPMTYAIFMSVGGGQNYIYDNDITVVQKGEQSPDRHGAYAFYIGGSRNGGVYSNNRVRANATPIWIANMYGAASNVTLTGNTFTRDPGSAKFSWLRLGCYKHKSSNVNLYSNKFPNNDLSVHIYDYSAGYTSSYATGWILKLKTKPKEKVVVTDSANAKAFDGKADAGGRLTIPLRQFLFQGNGRDNVKKTDVSAYKVSSGDKTAMITMDRDKTLSLK